MGSLFGRKDPANDAAGDEQKAFEWRAELERLSEQSVRYTFGELTFRDVLEGWEKSAGCRRFFTTLIAESEFRGLTWETPSLCRSGLSKRFEFVITDSPLLVSSGVDPKPFSEHFRSQPQAESVLIFPNLGGDALLVVPRQVGEAKVYGHLASFLRGAPEEQTERFWQQMAKAARQRFGDRPIWLSTAGLGVNWLHGRVCKTPKYYRHKGYT